jgi:chromosome segregation ATPase
MRQGVQLEEVVDEINLILASGGVPTVRSVRNKLGTGSLHTINKHMATWRGTQKSDIPLSVELSPSIMKAIASEIKISTQNATADLNKRLASSLEDSLDISTAAADQEVELEAIKTELQNAIKNRDFANGESNALQAELNRLRVDMMALQEEKTVALTTRDEAVGKTKALQDQLDALKIAMMETQLENKKAHSEIVRLSTVLESKHIPKGEPKIDTARSSSKWQKQPKTE